MTIDERYYDVLGPLQAMGVSVTNVKNGAGPRNLGFVANGMQVLVSVLGDTRRFTAYVYLDSVRGMAGGPTFVCRQRTGDDVVAALLRVLAEQEGGCDGR